MATLADSSSPGDGAGSSAHGAQYGPGPSLRARVFLAYRATPEGVSLAEALHHQLKDDYEVTFAEEMPPGTDWAAYIPPKLDEADFFVALMTRDACETSQFDYLAFEIDRAAELYRDRAKPVIIPVRVAHLEPYDYRIGPRLARFQEVEIEHSEDIGELVDKVKHALAGRPAPPRDTFGAVLGGYVLSERDRRRLKASHVDLPMLQNASTRLKAGDIVWLVGEAGVASYAAQSLAASTAADKQTIYVIPRGKSWQDVEKTLVAEATIVFRDALPSPFLSEDTGVSQFAALARLLSRGNRILLTAQEDAFEEARILMRRFGFRHQLSERLDHSSYSAEDKRHILNVSLSSIRSGETDQRPLDVMRNVLAPSRKGSQGSQELRQRFDQTLVKWTPSDVENFLLYHLPDIFSPADLARILQRNATLEDEIHAWFSDLDDSAKCFVTTVALVQGLEGPAIWERHKIVFDRLRRFDPKLALWPLGLSRRRSAPYVTQEGVLGFREERIAEAVRREIARSYREYLVELTPDLRRWTVGEGSPPAEDLLQIRDSVATMVGDAARVQLSDLLPLIETWADHDDGKIREVAAQALERLAADPPSQNVAFELLASWCARSQEPQRPVWVWSAVAAYGRIAARSSRAPDSRRAFERLVELAGDNRERVADKVVLAARKLVGRYQVDVLEDLFRRLARHRKRFVRLHLADAMNAARLIDGSAGERLLRAWVSDAEESLRRVAACCLILQAGERDWSHRADTALDILGDLLASDPATLTNALIDVIADVWPRWRKSGLRTLARLVKLAEERDSSLLAASFSKVLLEQRDCDVLGLLRTEGNRFDRFVIAVRVEDWKNLLASPDAFVAALEAESRHEPAPGEGHRIIKALTRLEETRNALIAALANHFAKRHEAIEDVLSWLRSARQPTVSSLSLEVRQQALGDLMASPNVFVELLLPDLRLEQRSLAALRKDPPRARRLLETLKVVSHLARQEVRASLVQALVRAHPANADAVECLLVDFRAVGAKKPEGAALARVAREAMLQILEQILAPNQKRRSDRKSKLRSISRADLVEHLRRMKQRPELWSEALNALQYLAEPSRETSRRQIIQAFASARRTKPHDVDSVLRDPSLRARKYLDKLWLWVRLEVWKPRIVAVAAAVLLGVIAAFSLLSNNPQASKPAPQEALPELRDAQLDLRETQPEH